MSDPSPAHVLASIDFAERISIEYITMMERADAADSFEEFLVWFVHETNAYQLRSQAFMEF